jgi:hypothetical protein
MVMQTTSELRISAARLREMASEGSDAPLQAALRLVADEFEREAARMDGLDSAKPEPDKALPSGTVTRCARCKPCGTA